MADSDPDCAMDTKAIHRALSFLNFPGEIRNKIYRLLVCSENALVKRPNRAYEDDPSEAEPWNLHEPKGDSHTLQAVSPWLTRYDFSTAILQVNRQIHEEAAGIFHDDNLWVIVESNTVGFASALKSYGFRVVSRRPPKSSLKPALRVILRFHHPTPTKCQESFVLSHDCLSDFARALWVTRGMRNLEVELELPATGKLEHSEVEQLLLDPLKQVRGIQNVAIKGKGKKAQIGLRQVMTVPYSKMAEIMPRVYAFKELGKATCQAGDWKAAQDYYLDAMCFIGDINKNCYRLIYPLTGDPPPEYYPLLEIICIISSNLAQCRIKLGSFRDAARNAKYVLTLTATPPHIKAKAWYRRGKAFVGMGEDREALKCLLEALKLFPRDAVVLGELNALKQRAEAAKKGNEDPIAEMVKSLKLEDEQKQERMKQRLAGRTVIQLGENSEIVAIKNY